MGGSAISNSDLDSGSSPDDLDSLRAELKLMEEEVLSLRQKLTDVPAKSQVLEERLLDTQGQLAQAVSQNEKLTYTLREAREHIAALREEVDKLTQPPSGYGTVLDLNEDGTADVFSAGRKIKVQVHPEIDLAELRSGSEVVLNESFNIIGVRPPEVSGEIVSIKELLGADRAMIVGRGDDERVVLIAEHLRGSGIRVGDSMLMDARSAVLVEKLPKSEVEDLVLEEVPDVSYEQIGGLADQIEVIVDAVELPFLHAELFKEHELPAPKGILLYGPPGCGKTLIAKAVANSLAKKVAANNPKTDRDGKPARSFFLNIKGPELLNKYVGETERQVRLIFQRAREKSEEGYPVIIFFDEMESLFRTRGTGVSSDMESTVVPQLLAEIDGVEALKNVIVIGASNREDLIDPAILRPGRLDVKIKIERPNEESAKSIFSAYLTENLPIHASELAGGRSVKEAIDLMIDKTAEFMYRTEEDTRFLEVSYQNGDKEVLHFKDFSSGAMIENIVRRAKKLAIKRFLDNDERGIKTDDLLVSVSQEYKEHEDLPNTTNPDDWAKISGKKGERIVYVRTLVNSSEGDTKGGKSIDQVATGQYL